MRGDKFKHHLYLARRKSFYHLHIVNVGRIARAITVGFPSPSTEARNSGFWHQEACGEAVGLHFRLAGRAIAPVLGKVAIAALPVLRLLTEEKMPELVRYGKAATLN